MTIFQLNFQTSHWLEQPQEKVFLDFSSLFSFFACVSLGFL